MKLHPGVVRQKNERNCYAHSLRSWLFTPRGALWYFGILYIVVAAMVAIFTTSLRERERDLAFDNALTKLCASYVRWTKLAHDHVEGMDRRCNLGAKE